MVSRVAKHPIQIPAGVTAKVQGQIISISGKLGALEQVIHPDVGIHFDNSVLTFTPNNESIESNALAGTSRALVNNLVQGVTKGFERKLTLVGVGYRAKSQGKVLTLSVGYSHPVEITMPAGVSVETPSVTEIIVKGANRAEVCQVAANIREVRPPEPYKGKGIRYANEKIELKEAKKK